MSVHLAHAWIQSVILGREAQDLAIRFIDRITADRLTGMLIVGPRR